MSVEKRDLFKVGPDHAASSGDGAGNVTGSAFDPSTGERNPSYKAPQASDPMDTKGRDGGLGQSP